MQKTTFFVSEMDCPSEEQMIRMKLQDVASIKKLQFDIPQRLVQVFHEGGPEQIATALADLKLGSQIQKTVTASESELSTTKNESSVLVMVLAINFILFLLEVVTGIVSKSMGLVADSLDMLADSIVYGLSLYAVGRAVSRKKQIARIAGLLQFVLAVLGFAEVFRRFLGFEEIPVFQMMIVVSVIALTGNAACLVILQKTKESGVHMKASWIFTSNDVIVNLGVILAGVLVHFTASGKPDLIVGSIVFLLVARGAYRIFKLS